MTDLNFPLINVDKVLGWFQISYTDGTWIDMGKIYRFSLGSER